MSRTWAKVRASAAFLNAHKQAITATVTSVTASLGAAQVISGDIALKATAVTGALMAVFALLHSLLAARENAP